MTVWASHRGFEVLHPDIAEYERLIHDRRIERGMPVEREFPCPGDLRVTGRTGDRLDLACDACRFETTVPAGRDLPDPNGRIESETQAF